MIVWLKKGCLFGSNSGNNTLNYDSTNNIIGWTDSNRSGQSTFGYDRIDRLTRSNTPQANQQFVYDANGNRTVRLGTDVPAPINLNYRAGSNRLLGFNLDRNGNLILDGQDTYQYDARNRMISSNTGNTRYTYNAMSQRVSKEGSIHSGFHTFYFYAWSNDRIIGEYEENVSYSTETVYLNDIPVAVLKGGQSYRIFADQIDTPRVITTLTNKIIWRWDSRPFGEDRPNDDVDGDRQRFNYDLRFPGQYYDFETGTHYNYHRDYDPKTGRYLQSDPIGIDGGVGTYTYVTNSPLLASDPNALDAVYLQFSGYPIDSGFGFNIRASHAGVLLINEQTGLTNYYEYGRYSNVNDERIVGCALSGKGGNVRKIVISDVIIGDDGLPTQQSLDIVYNELAGRAGKGIFPTATYFDDVDFEISREYVNSVANDADREQYSLISNNCESFATNVINAGQ